MPIKNIRLLTRLWELYMITSSNTINKKTMAKVNVYVNKLANDFGIDNLNEQERQDILSELNEAFEERVIINCLKEMDDREKTNLDKLIALETDFTTILNYLMENIPNILRVFDESYQQLKNELLVDIKI